MKTISILVAGLVVALPPVASAHDSAPIYRELSRQASLIDDGRRSGDLSRSEMRQLLDEQSNIRSMLQDAEYDGSLTGREVRLICAAQDEARRNIREQTNNDDVAYWRVREGDKDELGYPRELSRSGQAPGSGWGHGWGNRWGWGYGRHLWN